VLAVVAGMLDVIVPGVVVGVPAADGNAAYLIDSRSLETSLVLIWIFDISPRMTPDGVCNGVASFWTWGLDGAVSGSGGVCGRGLAPTVSPDVSSLFNLSLDPFVF